jgi:ribosomal protein S9
MRIFFIAISFCVVLISCKPTDAINEEYPQAALKSDFLLLKNIVLEAHAGTFAFNNASAINRIYDSVANSITKPIDIIEFYKKVNFVLQKLYCAHTSIALGQDVYNDLYYQKYFFPLPLLATNGNLYINTEDATLPLGAEIKSINHIPVAQIIKKLGTYYFSDGNILSAQQFGNNNDFAYHFFVEFGKAKSFLVEAVLPDSAKTVKIEKFNPLNLDDIFNNKTYKPYNEFTKTIDYDFEFGENKEAYLTINTFDFSNYEAKQAFMHFIDNSLDLAKRKGVNALVIDLRNNGGGYYSEMFYALENLVDKPLVEFENAFHRFLTLPYKENIFVEDTANITYFDTLYKICTVTEKGIYQRKHSEIGEYSPNTDLQFACKFYVMVNGGTGSAAAIFASTLKDKMGATIIGEETNGSNYALNSETIRYELPNSKIKVTIPLVRFYHDIDNKQKFSGLKPDIIKQPMQQDIADGRDAVLNYVIDSLIYK